MPQALNLSYKTIMMHTSSSIVSLSASVIMGTVGECVEMVFQGNSDKIIFWSMPLSDACPVGVTEDLFYCPSWHGQSCEGTLDTGVVCAAAAIVWMEALIPSPALDMKLLNISA